MKTVTDLNFQESEKKKPEARLPGSLSATKRQQQPINSTDYSDQAQFNQWVIGYPSGQCCSGRSANHVLTIGSFMTNSNTKSTAAMRFVSGFGQFHSNEPGAKKKKPYVEISLREIASMALNPQQVDKESAQWVIPSSLPSRTFAEQEARGDYGFLWADFDKDPAPLSAIVGFWEDEIGCKAIMYTSSSATEKRPKSRLIVPVAERLTFPEWTMAQECLADMMGEAGFTADYAACRSAQLCYLPNRGRHYDAYLCDGDTLDPMALFAESIAEKVRCIEEQKSKLEMERAEARLRRERFVASGKDSAVDVFNQHHTVVDVLIEAGYSQMGNKFRHPGSESGSYSASVRDGRVYSLSHNDPLYTGRGGGAHDAFGAFTVLFFGGDASRAARAVYADIKEAA
jgi:hypothetical protein